MGLNYVNEIRTWNFITVEKVIVELKRQTPT